MDKISICIGRRLGLGFGCLHRVGLGWVGFSGTVGEYDMGSRLNDTRMGWDGMDLKGIA